MICKGGDHLNDADTLSDNDNERLINNEREAIRYLTELCQELRRYHEDKRVYFGLHEGKVDVISREKQKYYKLITQDISFKENELVLMEDTYQWYNPLMPPEYRMAAVRHRKIELHASTDLFSMFALFYQQLCQQNLPVNYWISKKHLARLKQNMEGWDSNIQECIIRLLDICTSVSTSKRPQDVLELWNMKEFVIIKNSLDIDDSISKL